MVATSSNPCFPKIGWWFSIPNRNGSHPPSSALFYPWFWLQIGPRFWRAVWVILNWTFSSWCLWQRYRGSTCGGGCGNQQRPDILQMLPTQILLLHGFTWFYQEKWWINRVKEILPAKLKIYQKDNMKFEWLPFLYLFVWIAKTPRSRRSKRFFLLNDEPQKMGFSTLAGCELISKHGSEN